jgi:cytochrome c peroxidase
MRKLNRVECSTVSVAPALAISLALVLCAIVTMAQDPDEAVRMIDSMQELPVGLGILPEIKFPTDNPETAIKVELGQRLFFEKRLSGNGSMSCATCHDPQHGFSDGRARAVGSHGDVLARHTPTIFNAAYNSHQFWDGRAGSLEQQVVEPLTSNKEMSMTDEGELVARLDGDPVYHAMFHAVFGQPPDLNNVSKAIAAYERTVTTHRSGFDRYADGDKRALTLNEKQGLVLFIGKARCARCHNGPNFTDNEFHNTGIGSGDYGRFGVTHADADRETFKTPGLRNVTAHPPYMHDGSVGTLGGVIDYYDRGGNARKGKSPFIYRIGLSSSEKRDLLAFLKALGADADSPKKP